MSSRLSSCFLVAVLLVFCTGCCTNTITNLTPHTVKRSPDNLYVIEARIDSNQRTLLWNSLEPYLIIDGKLIPMQKSGASLRQYHTTVQIPPGKRYVIYQFRFDYLTQGFGRKVPDSRLSPAYTLQIKE